MLFSKKNGTIISIFFKLKLFEKERFFLMEVIIGFILKWAIYILAGICVLLFFGLTIFVHEFGHFITAKLFGLEAPIFSIGFGKAIWEKKIGGTHYKVGWLPFGGYVSLPQLDPSGMDKIQGESADGEIVEYKPADWWKRLLVAFAGPFFNFIFAIVLALLFYALPRPNALPDALRLPKGMVVGYVEESSPAEMAGFRCGDIITNVNGYNVETESDYIQEVHLSSFDDKCNVVVSNLYDNVVKQIVSPVETNSATGYLSIKGLHSCFIPLIDGFITNDTPAELVGVKKGDFCYSINGTRVIDAVQMSNLILDTVEDGKDVNLVCYRDGKFFDFTIKPKYYEEVDRKIIGIKIGTADFSVRPWAKYRHPVDQIKGDINSMFRILKSLFTPKHEGESKRTFKALGGPVQIFIGMWMGLMASFASFIGFIRFLNINLMVLNLLPLPVLDGGHIVFALWRAIFKREFPNKLLTLIINAFAILLIGFMIFITFRDVLTVGRIFSRRSDKTKIEKVEEAEELQSSEENNLILEGDVSDAE